MNKTTFLILGIVTIALLVVGQAAKVTAVYDLGLLGSFVAWVLGIIKMAQLKRWGWLVAVILVTPLATLLYGIYGPTSARGGLVA